jgi:transcriptional regulator with XRE-family HTH domain
MKDIDRAFGLAIRQFRTHIGISQEELAFLAGIHRTYISQIERGIKSPTLKVIFVLSKALNVNAYLLIQTAETLLASHSEFEDNVSPTQS